MKIAARLRPLIGGSYLVAGGAFMLGVAILKTPQDRLVSRILLAVGIALFVLGFLEIVTAVRRRASSEPLSK